MTQIPSKEQILQWIADNPALTARRDIAKAFGIKDAGRVELKRLLKELAQDGALEKRGRTWHGANKLPPVSILTILPPDRQGDQFARPAEWQGPGAEPRILFLPGKPDAPVAEGDRILARLTGVEGEAYQYVARLIRKIGSNPLKVLGIFRKDAEGGRILPIDKGAGKEWRVAREFTQGARDGELVEAEQTGPRRLGLPQARIVSRLGDASAPGAVSLIAIHQHGIPDHFPDAALAEADAARPATIRGREDLRDLPLVTIDPSDARDHDDAVFAEADSDAANPGGHILWVAIADVAHYVRPGSALDREARRRGNS
ncbi:MAG: RNB domain-containing ribonuclease, partial [Rhodobacter sp.]|nr:RNB domain-containing ribonuclease [Rhodobacter sp.]